MADLPVARYWEVEATAEVEQLWLDVKIQELRSRIKRTEQDIEDLQKGKMAELTANLKMLQLTLSHWLEKKNSIKG